MNKNILLGITGGIAAYKACNIVSLLKKRGYNVKVIMTENATNIITPLTLETLSRNPCYVDMWAKKSHYDVEHIALADWADVILIAPASYNIVGKIANGIADDMLTTVISASRVKKFFALAMNVNMYENPILKENIEKLKKYDYAFIEADTGLLACNYVAKGRLKNEEEIVNILERHFIVENLKNNLLPNEMDILERIKDKNILITASRTKENIDPVRYLSNNSSGKMGYALSKALADLGFKVTLISGPSNLNPSENLFDFVEVESARDMLFEVDKRFNDTDIFISCAAVADYRIKKYEDKKIKKTDGDLILELVRNPDILYNMGQKKQKQFLVGFAAETNDIKENSLKKLAKKNLDMIVSNNANVMNSDENACEIFFKNRESIKLESNKKDLLAYDLAMIIIREYIKKADK